MEYILKELLKKTIEKKASDLHLTFNLEPTIRVQGKLIKIGDQKLSNSILREFSKEILANRYEEYTNIGEIDVAYSVENLGRFRVNIYKQRNYDAIAIRVISLKVPSLSELNHPKIIKSIIEKNKGLILITGATGSGKSTTMAAIINEINNTREAHIITLEDPIEYLHKHNKSIINQREIGSDSKSYKSALKAALREDPDVILVGEMRDLDTISIAITAAETGHLVISTLHTIGAAKTLNRIIDVFPPSQQQQIKMQLSSVLEGIISQQLIPTSNKVGRVAALEIMVTTPAIRNLIREGKIYQIDTVIQTGNKYGMINMDMSLINLYNSKVITEEMAMLYSLDKEFIKRIINI
ncbi:MAG: type IV pilus twitching motility protein PilT, partial [Clostridium sp.]|nr:type IV pilus twitching motility protein PilT [Clostridium sp.]